MIFSTDIVTLSRGTTYVISSLAVIPGAKPWAVFVEAMVPPVVKTNNFFIGFSPINFND